MSAASRPVRSFPAAQWNKPGRALGAASRRIASAKCGPAQVEHLAVAVVQEVGEGGAIGRAARIPQHVDDRQLVPVHGHHVDREAPAGDFSVGP